MDNLYNRIPSSSTISGSIFEQRFGNIWDESKKEWKNKLDEPVFIAAHSDLGTYFLYTAPLSVIDNYRHNDYEYYSDKEEPNVFWSTDRKLNSHLVDKEDYKWRGNPPVNHVSFISNSSELKTKFKRPVIDEFGNTFWVDGNDFTGTCSQFRWDTIANLRFAREVKQYQDGYNKQTMIINIDSPPVKGLTRPAKVSPNWDEGCSTLGFGLLGNKCIEVGFD